MNEKDRIDEALRLERLTLPRGLRVVELAWEPYVDHHDDECVKIRVVLDDATTDREIERGPVSEIKRAIRDSLIGNQVHRFAYFSFYRKKDLEAVSKR